MALGVAANTIGKVIASRGGRDGGREEVSGGGIERERKGAWEQGRGET